MSKCTDIKDFCGDYSFDVEYSKDNRFTMFFNSLRNAETVKRCIEVDDSVPNVATAVDFVEVVRCKDCEHYIEYPLSERAKEIALWGKCNKNKHLVYPTDFCGYGERKEVKDA